MSVPADRAAVRPLALWRDVPMIWSVSWRLIVVKVLLVTLGYAKARALVSRWSGRPSRAMPEDVILAKRAGRLARGVARRLPFDAACLVQSLAVWWLLRQRGYAVDLQIGVAKDQIFAAHAWVTLGDVPVTDDAAALTGFGTFGRSGL